MISIFMVVLAQTSDASQQGLQTIADALVKTGVVAWVGNHRHRTNG
ncbi:hypothetical protein AB6F62_13315 [Providencia huaxiensis]